MKLRRVLLSCLLVLAVVLVCVFALPTEAEAATSGYYTYTVSGGKATITDVSTSISGAITIPSKLGGYPVAAIGSYAFADCWSLTGITIPTSITTIGDYAFSWCESLTSITIPASVTTIGDYAFENCETLKRVTLGSGISIIGEAVFVNCFSLTSITIPPNVTTIGDSAFESCTKLTSITIPASVTTIGNYAFSYCESLTSVTIPSSVTTIGECAFYRCTGLISVTIPDSVTVIGDSAFSACERLTGIWVDQNNKAYSNDAKGVLYNKNKTVLLRVPDRISNSYTIPASVTTIGNYAYEDCDRLTSITIPDSVTTIGNFAFSSCLKLTSVSIPDSVTIIGDSAFRACISLKSVVIPDSVTTIGDSAFAECLSISSITIPDSVETIGSYAFSWCESLYKITIPDSVAIIGEGPFYSCANLSGIWVDTKNPNYSSDECGALLNKDKSVLIQVPGDVCEYAIPDSVTAVGGFAFSGCRSLGSITIPDGVTSIGDSAFYHCESLYSITISDSVTSIGNSTFEWCESLDSIILSESVTSIGDSAFSGCRSLYSIAIPESVTSIGDSAFSYCWSLTRIDIPDSVVSIGEDAFYSCESLTYVTLGDSVKTIGSYAFGWCEELNSITVPESVTSIGDSAFCGCVSLADVYYSGTKDQWNLINIGDDNKKLIKAIRHYQLRILKQPQSVSVADGKTATISVSASGTELKYQWYYSWEGEFLKCSGTGKSSYSITMNESRAGRQMYCVITDEFGNQVQTETVTLGMKFAITKQPVSVNALKGKTVTFSVTATGAGLKYQWYYSWEGEFIPCSGTGKSSYSITMNESRAGRQMYCVITDKFGNTLQTNTVTMYIGATITQQPKTVPVKNGEKATISLTAIGEGLKYQWYYKYNGKFVKSTDVGQPTYSITMNKDRAGRQMYCVITDKFGNSVKSNTVTLGMAVSISKQPVSVTVANGKTATVSVTATGEGLKYQWYYSWEGDFLKCSGTGKSSYSIAMTESRAGRQMYCVITDKYGNKVQTDTVTLGMTFAITKQPTSTSAATGKSAKIALTATGAGLKYQWYYSWEGEFIPCSGTGKSSYSITMNESRAGRQMYCIITDKFGNTLQSDTVTLHMGPTITQQPESVQVKNGEKATIGLRATGEGLKYQWYYKYKGKFVKSTDVGQPTYSITMNKDRAGRQMYCVITDKFGTSVKSDVVTLGMAVSISTQPKTVTVAKGKTAKISVTATGDGLKYQWYYSWNGKFLACSGTGKSSYSITMNKDRSGRQMYCVITDKYGNQVQTNIVTLKMK